MLAKFAGVTPQLNPFKNVIIIVTTIGPAGT
jgi:hypothetical protein